ncbi:hypothetical protein [Paenibacillus hamazuiensis]|uniref:hypothetical protein n=1 Tax=Paenibacillus hamazuiensis TaxID=2936508 RepID=UPI00200CEB88|nr:hypothetical protein [Paenibacillus hamazuiensis]
MDDWKVNLAEKALEKGIINDPQWLQKLDEPVPLWAVLDMMLQLVRKLEPEYSSYD